MRPGPLGNPFIIGRDGTRAEVIEQFRLWVPTQPHIMQAIEGMTGKILLCCCKPKLCHGDVYVELFGELYALERI